MDFASRGRTKPSTTTTASTKMLRRQLKGKSHNVIDWDNNGSEAGDAIHRFRRPKMARGERPPFLLWFFFFVFSTDS